MATTFKGTAVTWGTSTAYSTGIVTSASTTKTASTEPIENGDGAMTGMAFYDEKYSTTATIVCQSTTTLPTIGDSITIGNVAAYVTSVQKNWTNKGAVQFTVTCESGSNMAANNSTTP